MSGTTPQAVPRAEADFRPMQECDLPWVAAEDQRLYPYPWSEGNFADSLKAGYSAWIMTLDGAPAGYGVIMKVLDEAHLLNISVVAAHQGQGWGRRLLDELCDVARAHQCEQMLLEVRPSNTPALGLYERYGFELIGRRKGYYPAAQGREDALVMRRPL